MKSLLHFILLLQVLISSLSAEPNNVASINEPSNNEITKVKKENVSSLRKSLIEKRKTEINKRDLLFIQRELNSQKRIRKRNTQL